MLLLDLMLVTVFVILLAISVGKVVDAHREKPKRAGESPQASPSRYNPLRPRGVTVAVLADAAPYCSQRIAAAVR